MRALLVVALLAIPAPALAESVYETVEREKNEAIARSDASMQAFYDLQASQRAKRAADLKASCAKVGGIRIGLTAAAVRASCWGKPTQINATQTATHTREQWVYGGGYVYLTDGVVDAIQTAR